MKIKNKNMRGAQLNMKGKLYVGDGDGVFDMDDEHAEFLLSTPGWEPVRKRAPRKAAKKAPPSPPKALEPPEPVEEEEEPETAAEEPEEAPEEPVEEEAEPEETEEVAEEEDEEVPPYEDWEYNDLVAEARTRMDADENFVAPDSKKKADVIAALYADDKRVQG